MARLAGPEVFGAFAAATALPGFASLFAESGMQGALIQRRDRIEEAAATAVIATFAAGIGLSLVALAMAPLVGLYFDDSEIGLAAAALSGILFLNAITAVPDALMQRRFSFLRRVIVDPLNMLTYGIVSTVLLAAGLGIWGLVIGLYAATIVRVLAAWVLARWRPQLRLASFAMWRELVSFGRHVVASEFLREIGAMVNIALVGRVFGVAPLGQFRFGHRLAAQATTPIVVASAYVLFPAFSRIADDEERLRSAALRSFRVLAVAVFPISLALVPLGAQLVLLLLGDQWEQAGRILAALCGMTAALPLTTDGVGALQGDGRATLPDPDQRAGGDRLDRLAPRGHALRDRRGRRRALRGLTRRRRLLSARRRPESCASRSAGSSASCSRLRWPPRRRRRSSVCSSRSGSSARRPQPGSFSA